MLRILIVLFLAATAQSDLIPGVPPDLSEVKTVVVSEAKRDVATNEVQQLLTPAVAETECRGNGCTTYVYDPVYTPQTRTMAFNSTVLEVHGWSVILMCVERVFSKCHPLENGRKYSVKFSGKAASNHTYFWPDGSEGHQQVTIPDKVTLETVGEKKMKKAIYDVYGNPLGSVTVSVTDEKKTKKFSYWIESINRCDGDKAKGNRVCSFFERPL